MSVVKLNVHNFRNLDNKAVVFHPEFNFFIGENGSGKSSLLEALFFLGHGKSFRTSKIDALACFNKSIFTVSIKDSKNTQLGLSRDINLGSNNIKIDGESRSRLSDLAKNIAIQIVTPESFKLFFGGTKERRRFIDLGMFHVKHNFSSLWKNLSRVLKQRNACIRLGVNSQESHSMLSYWTEQFCQMSLEVAELRSEYTSALIDELDIWLSVLLPDLKSRVTVQYLQGWSQKGLLKDILESNLERELKYGYTLYGAHKFDVRFLLDNHSLETQLSRGQQKLFLLALTFAQAKLISRVNLVKPILLIDDIGAELDINSRTALSLALTKLNCQVLITAIENDVLYPFYDVFTRCEESESEQLTSKDFKVFHVKHGEITEKYPDDSEYIIRKSN